MMVAANAFAAPAFTVLPGTQGRVPALGAHGAVGVGYTVGSSGYYARYWIAGVRDFVLPSLGGTDSFAFDVSQDGLIVVGTSSLAAGNTPRAFRWTAPTGTQDLGTLGGAWSRGAAITADGSLIVGTSQAADGSVRAFQWSVQAGMTELSPEAPFAPSGMSANGARVVGSAIDGGKQRAVQWTTLAGRQFIDFPQEFSASAFGVSDDGSVVYGTYKATSTAHDHAFRWTQGGGVEDLGVFGNGYTYCYASSADGSLMGGYFSASGIGLGGFLWTPQTGLQNATELLLSLGVDLQGWSVWAVDSISADGSTLAGKAYRGGQYRGFVVSGLPPVPAPAASPLLLAAWPVATRRRRKANLH